MSESLEAVRSRANMAAAELRHAYRGKQDWELVARAIRMLEAISTPVAVDAPPEPTTAEAFATVRQALESVGYGRGQGCFSALTLLERRMGAMARAARAVLAEFDDARLSDLFGPEAAAIRGLRAALTDALPVFMLEEVEEAMRRAVLPPSKHALVLKCLRS